jgi:hypothetical protein
MPRALSLAAVALLLASCAEGPLDPGRFTVQGSWHGRAFPYELLLELRHDRENRVSGTGELRGLRERVRLVPVAGDPARVDTLRDTIPGDTVRFEVRGQWRFPTVELDLEAPGRAPARYTGEFVRDAAAVLSDSIAGRFSGSGLDNVALPIGRIR